MLRTVLMSVCIIALLAGNAPSAQAQDADEMEPVVYVAQYKIQSQRLDSLNKLISSHMLPYQEFVASKVPGYEASYYVHDTGGEYNLVVMTTYPDWDYVRGDEIQGLLQEYKTANNISDEEFERVNEAFGWAYEGSTHVDNILRPITADE